MDAEVPSSGCRGTNVPSVTYVTTLRGNAGVIVHYPKCSTAALWKVPSSVFNDADSNVVTGNGRDIHWGHERMMVPGSSSAGFTGNFFRILFLLILKLIIAM